MRRIAIVAIIAITGTSCLAPPPDLSEPSTEAAAQQEAIVVTDGSADHEGGEEADHHEEEADHEHEGDEPADHHEAGTTVEGDVTRMDVIMTEHAFDPSSFTVKEGETVQFHLINEGIEEHEFRLTTMHAAEEHIASGHEGHDDDAMGGHGHDELLMLVPAGQTRVFSMTFEHAGAFDVVACLIPGHFENGMFADLTYNS